MVEPSSARFDGREFQREALRVLREKLIDVGRSNPLINFKHSERGAGFIRVVDELPDVLFAKLRSDSLGFEPLPDPADEPNDEKTAEFQVALEAARLTDPAYLRAVENLGEDEGDADKIAAAEAELRIRMRELHGLPMIVQGRSFNVLALARAHGIDPSYDLPPLGARESDHFEDDKIRVLFTREQVERKLRSIFEKNRQIEAETGIHTLQIAFGFLEWRDARSSTTNFAPLLMMPVQLNRRHSRGHYIYELSGNDEDLSINLALQEMLKRAFSILLPPVGETDTPESWLSQLASIIEHVHELKIRRFVTIGIFPFPNMALWRDLDTSAWPEESIVSHEAVGILLGAKSAGGGAIQEDYRLDDEPHASDAPPIVVPADVSQHSALIDIVAGHNVVIEGPPGTGKSQTITNIIAAALDKNKRVLFLAEKRAALNVVANRLKEAGFGELILELHSNRATKADILASLSQRFAATPLYSSSALVSTEHELRRQKETIRRYLSSLRHPVGSVAWTVHELMWRAMKLRAALSGGVAPALLDKPVTNAASLATSDLAGKRDVLTSLERSAKQIVSVAGSVTESFWSAARELSANPFGQEEILACLKQTIAAVQALDGKRGSVASTLRVEVPDNGRELNAWCDSVAALPAISSDSISPALGLCLARHSECDRLIKILGDWVELHRRADLLHPDLLSLPHELVTEVEEKLRQAGAADTSLDQIEERTRQQSDLARLIEAILAKLARFAAILGAQVESITAEAALRIEAVAGAASDLGDEVWPLRSRELLDEMRVAHLKRGRSDATPLRERENALSEDFDLRRARSYADPDLQEASKTIKNAGVFVRIFGRRYRLARALAKDILRPARRPRHKIARLLDQVAAYLLDEQSFAENEALAGWFGPAWRGHHSDFEPLLRLCALLSLAAERDEELDLLLSATQPGIKAAHFTFSDEERALLKRIGQGVPLAGLHNTGARAAESGRRAIEALTGAGIHRTAAVPVGAGGLAEMFQALRETSGALETLRADGMTWTGMVPGQETLDDLALAREQAAQVSAAAAPASVVARLKEESNLSVALKEFRSGAESLREASVFFRTSSESFLSRIRADTFGPLSALSSSTSLAEIVAQLTAASNDLEGLRLQADLLRYLRLAEQEGVSHIYTDQVAAGLPSAGLADIFELSFIRTLLRGHLQADGGQLDTLGGETLALTCERFRKLDQEIQDLHAHRIVATRLGDSVPRGVDSGPRSHWTDGALIRNEIAKKRGVIPIRQLVRRAAGALQAMKPVWMTSPHALAQFAPPESARFDLVVIDEASQMRPELAVGALARGGQIVVIGDPKQLPPTNFFQAASDDDSGDNEAAIDIESILDLAFDRLQKKRQLKWHYRSRHPSLIQFSNKEFYGGNLVVFPNAQTDDELLGVKSNYIGGIYEGRVNQDEAKAVVAQAHSLMYQRPELSIAIATMNLSQRDLIREEIDRLSSNDSTVRAYLERWDNTVEPLIVYNLESIQGEERDVVLVSTLYGPESKGGRVMQRFGPINSAVGHRRLNVLFTRAKRATLLFTSLRPTDVTVTEKSHAGVRAFQSYLTYASAGAQTDGPDGGAPDSDFEIFVADRLNGAGYEVVPQVGVNAFRIDLGVRDPDRTNLFLAGIECDGASYHSGFTVRDRDRTRQDVLEGLGWRIYRVWSTDWFNDPDKEMTKLVAWLNNLRRKPLSSGAEGDNLVSDIPPPLPSSLVAPEPVATPAGGIPALLAEGPAPRPSGQHRRLDDSIDYYEVEKGLFEVWCEGSLVGEVERLGIDDVGPSRIYSGQKPKKPRFRGAFVNSETFFETDDIYDAVRRVARGGSE